jgi:hypothetical protein
MRNNRKFALVACAFACAVVSCDSISRPSEAEIRQCVATDSGLGSIDKVEFGNTIPSQGGMMELAMGAPKDTKIFPVNIHFPYGGSTTVRTYWAFKDSFGQLKCVRAPGAETRTYQTPAQVVQEAERRRLAAQQQAEQAERQRTMANAENQRMLAQAAAQRLAVEHANEERQKQVRAANEALASSDCGERQLPVPSKSEVTFVVPSTRECWTPWLVPGELGIDFRESGNALVQIVFKDGTIRAPFVDGPTTNVNLGQHYVQKIRFKSLGKEPVTITFIVK